MDSICCLTHTTSIDFIEKILLDGYLRSPKDTGNYYDSNYYGENKIHFRGLLINSDVEVYHLSCAFVLDKNLVLRSDCHILDISKNKVLGKQKRLDISDKLGPHNDIFFSKQISLKKYLKTIIIFKKHEFKKNYNNLEKKIELINNILQKHNFNNVKVIVRYISNTTYFYKKKYRYENNILWNAGGSYLKYDPEIC